MFNDVFNLLPNTSVASNEIDVPLATSLFALILNIYSFSPCEYRLIQSGMILTLTVLIRDVSSVTFNLCLFSSTLTAVTFLPSTSMDLLLLELLID